MVEKIRIALMNDSFPPVLDGVANVVSNYARILQRNDCEVAVATPEYPGAADDYAYPVIRYPSFNTTKLVGYRAGYPFSARTVDAINQFKPDILHTHCPFSSMLLARTLRESTHAPIVFTYHTKYDVDIRTAIKGERLQNRLIRALVRHIEASDEVWVVSQGAGRNLRELGYEGTYRVMENGADMPPGPAPIDDIRAVSEIHKLDDKVPVLLFTGRLRWYKGIRLILEGLAIAKARGAQFKMLFVGDGSDLNEIKALAQELQLTEACILAGAVHDRDLLRAYYSRADLFLFPSTFDTNGIVVREAAACALPSLLVRGSCAAEGVTDGVNGLLTDENAESLAAQVMYACAHRQKLQQLGERAMHEVYISWETAVARAYARYEELLHERKENPPPPRRDALGSLAAEVMEAHLRLREWQDEHRS